MTGQCNRNRVPSCDGEHVPLICLSDVTLNLCNVAGPYFMLSHRERVSGLIWPAGQRSEVIQNRPAPAESGLLPGDC